MKKKLLLIMFLISIFTSSNVFGQNTQYLQKYSDVSTWHWAFETIEKLSSKGIISGYPDGTFMPEKTITRAEATKLLMVSFNENLIWSYGRDVCSDVPASHWASKYIVNGNLFVTPYEDGLFRPEQEITRLEFVNAVAKALRFIIITTDADTNVENISLKDISALDAESIQNIKFLVKLGIINGYEDGTFRPHQTLTRAETAKILSLAFIYVDGEITSSMAGTEEWYQCDPISGWRSPVAYDTEGNIKFSVMNNGGKIDLYYNGEYFMTANPEIRTVKQEKLYTKDGKEWGIKWFGSDVVEYKIEDDGFKIINHYQEKEYSFDEDFIYSEEAIKILEDLFPYSNFAFVEEENRVWLKQYTKDSKKEISSATIGEYKYQNRKIKISLKELSSTIWSEEANGNTQDRIENNN